MEKIGNFGAEAGEFCRLLRPLARGFVRSFDDPVSKEVVAFWRAMVCWEKPSYGMSGAPARYLSGWIATFCFFNREGGEE